MNRYAARVAVSIFLMGIAVSLRSQSITASHIKSQIGEFRRWLDSTGLHQYLSLDTIKQEEDSPLTATFATKGLQNWRGLETHIGDTYHRRLGEILFNRFTFQFDLPKESGRIIVDAGDAVLVLRNQHRQITEDTLIAQGGGDNYPVYTFTGLRMMKAPVIYKSMRSIEELRNRIKNYCQDYFKDYVPFLESYKFEDLSQDPESLRFVVSNIKKAVLSEGYFEHLEFSFSFRRDGGQTEMSWRAMDGKYGSGILWAPYDDRYKPMVPDYESEVDHFMLVMGNKFMNLIN